MGLIKDVPSVDELFKRMIAEAESIDKNGDEWRNVCEYSYRFHRIGR